MPIDDLLGADVNQKSVTCKALDVFDECSGTSQEKTPKAIPLCGIDRLPRLLTWSAQIGCTGQMDARCCGMTYGAGNVGNDRDERGVKVCEGRCNSSIVTAMR